MTTQPNPFPAPEFTINAAAALFDGDAYREMVALVGAARASVRLEFFLFGGPVADAIIDLLVTKRTAGVDVRVTLDRARGLLPAVRRECAAAYRRLRRENLDVVLSDPRPFPDSPGRPAITHNKIIVVDDAVAMVGGMNVGTPFFRHHDVMIRLEGPAAAVLARQFDHDRALALDRKRDRPAGSPLLPPVSPPETATLRPEESWVRLLGTGVGRRTTEQAIRQNLRAARASVDLTMSEIGRTNALRDLIEAHRTRGVSVRVLVDPQDMTEYLPALLGPLRRRWPKAVLNALAVRTLLDAGVAVRYFAVGGEFALLHMKAAVFDNARAIVGSTNWTRGGFEWVGETDVELHGGLVIDTLQKRFGTDWERATPAPIPSRSVQILSQIYEHLIQNGSYARADGLQ